MYRLELSKNDVKTIGFVGFRYAWADALKDLDVGVNNINENKAWEIAEAFESDIEGGHFPFPMLADGELMCKLIDFWDGVV